VLGVNSGIYDCAGVKKMENSTGVTDLTREYFLQRLTEVPNLVDLFGLFDFFEHSLYVPNNN
jgi:hypothetical protein